MKKWRKDIRLKDRDYSKPALYLVTLVTKNRAHLFGKVVDGQMLLNDVGKMVEKWYFSIEDKFKDITCDEMIIMPDHLHCILQNVGTSPIDEHSGPPVKVDPRVDPGEHLGSSDSPGEATQLSRVIQWFKTMTTNEYIRNVKQRGWPRFNGKMWQENYWERVIRKDGSYFRLVDYIRKNPENWSES